MKKFFMLTRDKFASLRLTYGLLLALLFSFFIEKSHAQPTNLVINFGLGVQNVALSNHGTFSSGLVQATAGGAFKQFHFNVGNDNMKWAGTIVPQDETRNSVQVYLGTGAYYFTPTTASNSKELEANVAFNFYYTFNITNNAASNNSIGIMESNYIPVDITSVAQTPALSVLNVNTPAAIVITTSGTPANGITGSPVENIFVRYTTDNFMTSSFVKATIVGTTSTAVIPGQPAGTQVCYYALSTLYNTTGIFTISHANADVVPFKVNNNGNAYYKYTVESLILPVELTSFKGEKKGNAVYLKWQTLSEQNNAGFEIERSADGQRWERIGFVQGNKSTTTASNYQYIDANPKFGANYYRLGQIDFNGKKENSPIVMINFDTQGSKLTISPNPVKAGEILTIGELDEKTEAITLTDMFGRTIWQSKTIGTGLVKIALPSSIPKGTYLLVLDSKDNKSVKSIVIQ